MCTYLDQLEERGWSRGIAEGEARGEAKQKQRIISRMLSLNPIDTVVKYGGFSYEEVKLVYEEMLRKGPLPYGS